MARHSALPLCESHRSCMSRSSPQGGRQQREHIISAPTPKRLSNGSEARHAPADSKGSAYFISVESVVLANRYLRVLSRLNARPFDLRATGSGVNTHTRFARVILDLSVMTDCTLTPRLEHTCASSVLTHFSVPFLETCHLVTLHQSH